MIYIVILHWNNYRCTEFCLQSLAKIRYEPHVIVVVDNCSTDGSFEMLKDSFPSCTYLQNQQNLGFARGTNVGMQYAYEKGADYVILLNNDVEVESDFIEALIAPTIGKPDVALVTPKILYRHDKNKIWHAGGHIVKSTFTGVSRGYDEIDQGQYDTLQDTQWASGACCLVTRRGIHEIGFLEEKYFFGQEEWDYSSTAIRNGFKIIYAPKAKVYHEVGQSSVKSPALYAYQNVYNKFVYAQKFSTMFGFIFWSIKYVFYLFIFFPKRNLPNDSVDEFYLQTAKRAAIWGVYDFFFYRPLIDAHRIKLINEKLMKYYRPKK